MMKIIMTIVLMLPNMVFASSLAGDYVAQGQQGLGCAYPGPQYELVLTQSLVPTSDLSYARSVTMTAKTRPGSAYKFNCEANYEGELVTTENEKFFGGLTRVGCSCEGMAPRQAEGVCRAQVDPFILERENVELSVTETEEGFAMRQLDPAPESPRWPCGNQYPQYFYQQL